MSSKALGAAARHFLPMWRVPASRARLYALRAPGRWKERPGHPVTILRAGKLLLPQTRLGRGAEGLFRPETSLTVVRRHG